MGKTLSTLAVVSAMALSMSPALAAAEVHGYGGDDDCRTGTRVIRAGHVECDEHENEGNHGNGNGNGGGRDDHATSTSNGHGRDDVKATTTPKVEDRGRGSDDKKPVVTPPPPAPQATVLNQVLAFLGRIFGRRG